MCRQHVKQKDCYNFIPILQLLFTTCRMQVANFMNWYLREKQDGEINPKFVPFSGENCVRFSGYVNCHNDRRLWPQDFKTNNTLSLSALCTGRLYPTGNIPGTHFC